MIPNITTGADFDDLITYLVVNRDHQVLDIHGVSSVALAAEEMAAVAALNTRAKVKLVHLSLSAAIEDGVLSDERWKEAADTMTLAFGLKGHQRVVVRHRDKGYDHVHIFWCTISPETGMTPPKRWFLRKGHAIDEVGPQALTDDQVERVPADHRALRTYDFIVLRRAQHLCRAIEKKFKLRELRSPESAKAARLAGEERAPSSGQQKRAERTGAVPLHERVDDIRTALDEPDWPSKRRALSVLGLDLEPVLRTTKNGEEIRGIVIFDVADPGNRMKASQLDTSNRKYGWKKLEDRHASGSRSFVEWWPHREATTAPGGDRAVTDQALLKRHYDGLLAEHERLELDKRARLKELRRKQRLEVQRLRRRLMKRRRDEALKKSVRARRAFYRDFDAAVRAPILAKLAERHRVEARPLARSPKPSWQWFLRESARLGNLQAMRVVDKASRAAKRVVAPAANVGVSVRERMPTPQATTLPVPQAQPSLPPPQLSDAVLLEAIQRSYGRGR